MPTAPELKLPRNPRAPKTPDPAFEQYSASFKELTKPVEDAFGNTWQQWQPEFSDYGVVILNYNGQDWP